MGKQPATENGEKNPTEYDRFEKLTKGLLSVPKKEIDEQRQREERERARGRTG